jgi:hypothetical protein
MISSFHSLEELCSRLLMCTGAVIIVEIEIRSGGLDIECRPIGPEIKPLRHARFLHADAAPRT